MAHQALAMTLQKPLLVAELRWGIQLGHCFRKAALKRGDEIGSRIPCLSCHVPHNPCLRCLRQTSHALLVCPSQSPRSFLLAVTQFVVPTFAFVKSRPIPFVTHDLALTGGLCGGARAGCGRCKLFLAVHAHACY